MRQSALLRWGAMESRPVARAGIEGMFRGRPLVVPGLLNKLTMLVPRLLPRRWIPRLVRRVQKDRGRRSAALPDAPRPA